ncbi:ER membrane protein complex subunit [Paramyrothecium foliicola]|nr:ER membrane protein complex subunit [Paramyrothecium foliicola]
MRRSLQSALVLGLSALVAAVFQDEVGDIDFHHALLGVPQVETTFFHRPRKEDKASLLYTLSDLGVIGAVNPSNGAIVWRQQIAANVTNGGGFLRAPEGENWVAAAYGQRVEAWNALTGRNGWHIDFKGEARDLEIMEVTENGRKDVLVLFDEDGTTVLRRLHGKLGTVVWEFREISKDIPLQVSTDISNIYVISLHGSPSSYSLKITSLDTVTGTRVDNWSVGTKGDVHGPRDVMFVGGNSAAPILAWVNQGLTKISVHVLGTKTKQDFALSPEAVSVHIHAPHITQALPHFLVHTRTASGNRAEVYHTNLKTGQVSKAYELPHLPGQGAFSTSSEHANVYFTRVTTDEVVIVSSESPSVIARWPLTSAAGAAAVHAVSDVVKKAGGEGFAVRTAVVTSTDNWVMVRNGEQDWVRPEGLSGVVAATFGDIPEAANLAKALEEEAHTNPVSAYIHRVTRHIDDLKYLPDYLMSIPQNLVNSVLGTETVSRAEGLHRDIFGFNKVIVLVTRRGRVVGLDTGNQGKILWSVEVFPQVEGKTFEARGILPQVETGFVTIYGSKGEYALIEAVSGEVQEVHVPGLPTRISSTAIVQGVSGPWLLPIAPEGLSVRSLFHHKTLGQVVVARTLDGGLRGFRYESDEHATETDLWEMKLLPGRRIVAIGKPPLHDPVASIGRVLGDRRVDYKYLNPNTIVLAIVEDATSTLSVQLVDTISGQVLVSQSHQGVDTNKAISCAMAENWYVCSFFGQYTLNDGSNRSIKGYQIAVADLYESSLSDDRGPLGDAANFSSLNPVDNYVGVPLPHVVSQTFVLSQPIQSLSVTQTKQGITNRQLLAYLPDSHAVVGIPRMHLDPRRPVGRNPTPAEMEAEGLAKYSPSLEIDPLTMLSHERDVIGIKDILAVPAVVESTSLIVAYGVDVFGSRVAPSGVFDILGKGFDKLTLILTVVALFGGVMFLAPMVSSTCRSYVTCAFAKTRQ